MSSKTCRRGAHGLSGLKAFFVFLLLISCRYKRVGIFVPGIWFWVFRGARDPGGLGWKVKQGVISLFLLKKIISTMARETLVDEDLDNIFYGDEPDEHMLPRKKVRFMFLRSKIFSKFYMKFLVHEDGTQMKMG